MNGEVDHLLIELTEQIKKLSARLDILEQRRAGLTNELSNLIRALDRIGYAVLIVCAAIVAAILFAVLYVVLT